MPEFTLESMAERLDALERLVARLDLKLTIARNDAAQSAAEQDRPAEPSMTFAERYRNWIGKLEGLPEDAASNVDYYLRNGLPKPP